jgi:hypothetical protein
MTIRNLKYRYTLFLLGALILIIGSSCRDESANYKKVDNLQNIESVKQVRFIGQWLNEGKRETLVRDFVLKYEFENQDVDVILKFPEEVYFDRSDTYSNQRFVSQIMSKENPDWDIIRINNQFEEVVSFSGDSLWARKYLVDFSEYPDYINNTKPDLLTDQLKKRWGGIIPGPFIEGQFWAMWTNKKVTDKIGIEVKEYGMTVDDFIEYIKAVDVYNKHNPDDYIVPIHDGTDWRTAFAIAFNIYISALNNPELLFTRETNEQKLIAWHKTLKVLEEISNYNPYDPDWESVTWTGSRFDLINEKCLFYTNGSWMYNIWNMESAEHTMNCFPHEFPSFNEMHIYPSSYQIMWAVLKNSPNKDEAVKFLLDMNKPDIAEMWVQYTKCPTGIKGKLTDVSFGSDQFETFSFNVQKIYGNNTYNYTEVLSEFITGNSENLSTHYRDVLLGNISADEAMVDIRSQIK